MVSGLATIGLSGFSMVANHWSNDGIVMIHRYGLILMFHRLFFIPELCSKPVVIFDGVHCTGCCERFKLVKGNSAREVDTTGS